MKNKVLKITFCSIMAAMAIALNSVASLQITPATNPVKKPILKPYKILVTINGRA